MTATPLAAIRFDTGDIDAFLIAVAQTLTSQGFTVRGALQSRGVAAGECHCADMDLTTIGSKQAFRISQPLGNGSHGCRLDPGKLANCSSFLERELEQGADLLILNRFGKGESEGRGFRDLIGRAVGLNIPVLTAVRETYVPGWLAFGAGASCDLPMTQDAVATWFAQTRHARAA